MQKLIIILITSVLNLCACQAQGDVYIFNNVNIITMKDDQVLTNKTVVVHNGKIIEIADKAHHTSKNIIADQRKHLMPTMGEAHIQFPRSDEELGKVIKLNPISGVTRLGSMRGHWHDYSRRLKYNTKRRDDPTGYL